MIYNLLGFAITDKCNANCKMCCFSCDMSKNNVLGTDIVESVLKQASEKTFFKQIGFSGGEAFLYYDELLEMIGEARKYKFSVSCFTNAFWCKDYETTRSRLVTLKKNGLDAIRTSIDACHQEAIDINNIKNLLRASKDVGLKCFVNIGMTKSTKKGALEIIDKLDADIFNHEALFSSYLPIGRAAVNFDESDFYNLCHKSKLKCTYNDGIPVMSNGDVYSCHASAMINTGLKIGNAYEDSLDTILKRIKKSPRDFIMMTRGISWFVKTIEENNLATLKDYYVNACHFCHEVFGNKALYEALIPYMEKEYNK